MPEASGVLEPKLTPYDRKVLALIPVEWTEYDGHQPGIDLWSLGRALNERDLDGLQRVLDGFAHFGLAFSRWRARGNPDLWHRSKKGTAALTASARKGSRP